MKLYIKVENGQAVGHPSFEDNLIQAFPEGIPDYFEPFERFESPPVSSFSQTSVCTYVKDINGVWHDSWLLVEMTEEELNNKIKNIENMLIQQAKDYAIWAQSQVLSCIASSDSNGVLAWENYIKECENWVPLSIYPTQIPAFPKRLIKDAYGNWVTRIN